MAVPLATTPRTILFAERIVTSWANAVLFATGRTVEGHMRRMRYGGKKGRSSRRRLAMLAKRVHCAGREVCLCRDFTPADA